LYRYIGSNPLRHVDPLGLLSEDSTAPKSWDYNLYLAHKGRVFSTTKPVVEPVLRPRANAAAEKEFILAASRKNAEIWMLGNCASEAAKIIERILNTLRENNQNKPLEHWRLHNIKGWKWGHGVIIPVVQFHNVVVAVPKDPKSPHQPFIMDFWNKDGCGKLLIDWMSKWHISEDQFSRDGWNDVLRFYGQSAQPSLQPFAEDGLHPVPY